MSAQTISIATWRELVSYDHYAARQVLCRVLKAEDSRSVQSAIAAGFPQVDPEALNELLHGHESWQDGALQVLLDAYGDWIESLTPTARQSVLEGHLRGYHNWLSTRAMVGSGQRVDSMTTTRAVEPLRCLRHQGAELTPRWYVHLPSMLLRVAAKAEIEPFLAALFPIGQPLPQVPLSNTSTVDLSVATLAQCDDLRHVGQLADAFLAHQGHGLLAQWTTLLERGVYELGQRVADPRLGPLLTRRVLPSAPVLEQMTLPLFGDAEHPRSFVAATVGNVWIYEDVASAVRALTWLRELGLPLDDLDSEDERGTPVTPLALAVQGGNETTIAALLALDCDPGKCAVNARSPLDDLQAAFGHGTAAQRDLVARAQAIAARYAVTQTLGEARSVAAP